MNPARSKRGVERPVPAVVRFHLRDPEDSARDFLSLGADLAQSGLILEAPRELRRSVEDPALLELICVFVDSRAARVWRRTASISRRLDELGPKLTGTPAVIPVRDVGFEVDDVRACACRRMRPLYVKPMPAWSVDGSHVVCGSCRGHLPGYRVPAESLILGWIRTCSRVFEIWYLSDVLEAWAERELSDLESELNVEGRKRCGALERCMLMPVYFCAFRVEEDQLARCPECLAQLQPVEMSFPRQVCHGCRLAF